MLSSKKIYKIYFRERKFGALLKGVTKTLCLLNFLLIMTACWGPREKVPSDVESLTGVSSSFYIENVNGHTLDTSVSHSNWNIPTETYYSFKACAINTSTKTPIVGQKFEIVKGMEVYETTESQTKGCFLWKERIPYNFFADSQYVFEDRVVRAKNNYMGEYKLEIAINPWVKSRNENLPEAVHHLVDEILPEEFWSTKGNDFALFDKSKKRELWVDSASINIIGTENPFVVPELSSQTGYGLKLDLSFVPTIQLKKTNGAPYSYRIKKGKFKVFVVLIADELGDNGSHKMILNPNEAVKVGAVDEKTGLLEVSLKTVITGRPDGILRLGLRVVPEDGPSDVGIYEFVYTLDTYNKLVGKGKQLKVTQEMLEKMDKFTYASYISSAKNYKELVQSQNVLAAEPYHFSALDVKFVRIAEGETATERTVLYKVEACITDAMGVPVREKSKWLVKKIKDDSLMPQTPQTKEEYLTPLEANDRGCVPWTDTITHKYYQRENYVYPKVQITPFIHHLAAQKNNGEAFTKELGMAVNPWDEKWTFGADIRSYPKAYLEALKERVGEGLPPTYLQIYDFRYVTIGFRYNIDRFMNLTVRKKILLRLDPKVLRYSSIIFGRRGTERIRDGLYLLKIAIQKDYLDPASKAIEIVKNEDNLDGTGLARTHIIRPRIDEKLSEQELDVVMKAKPKTRQQITTVTKIVRVNDGVIITPVEFSMRDLRLMKMRSNMLIQLETIDEKALAATIEFESYLEEAAKVLRKKLGAKNIDVADLKEFLNSHKGLQFKDRIEGAFSEIEEQRHVLRKLTPEERQQIETSHRLTLEKLVATLTKQHNYSYSGKWKEEQEYLVRSASLGKMSDGSPRAAYSSDSIQSLYIPFGLPQDLIDRTNNTLRLNDFTVSKAYIETDLIDLLIERNSGLARRTFIGPVTFIFNTNGSSMRPTDNLDEVNCPNDDCNLEKKVYEEADNSAYEHSPYFGSIRHMQGVHVDDLIEKKKDIDRKYYYEMSKASLLFNYIKFFDIDYVSLQDKPLKYFDERMAEMKPECYGYNFESCLKSVDTNTVKINDFYKEQGRARVKGLLSRLQEIDTSLGEGGWFSSKEDNATSSEELEQELYDFVNNDVANDDLKLRICGYMSTLYDEYGEKKEFHQALYTKCKRRINNWILNLEQAKERNKDAPIDDVHGRALDVNTKYIVNRTNRYRYIGGKSMNFNVGTNFFMNDDISMGQSASYQITSPTLFNFMPSVGTRSDITQQRRTGTGIQISSQTFLVMQTATLKLELAGYEVCKMIKWNQDFLNDPVIAAGTSLNLSDAQERKFPAAFNRLMICSGRNSEQTKSIKEHYYYFTQHFTDGDMLDPGDLNNHPWLIALRGYYDYKTFISMIEGNDTKLPRYNNVKEKVATKMFPIDRLKMVYRNALPTFPGIHTVVTEKTNIFDYPVNNGASDSFDWIKNEDDDFDFGKAMEYRGERSSWTVPAGEDPN